MIEERLAQRCHFLLHGHQHLPRVNVLESTIGDMIVIPAGASWDRRRPEDPRYVNAYNFVHLDLKTGEGKVFLRRWKEVGGGKWDVDTDLWPGGQFSFSLIRSKEPMTPERRDALHKLKLQFGEPLKQRFYKKLEVEIRHELVKFKGVEFVKHHCEYKVKVAAGLREPFCLRTFVNKRVVRLLKRKKIAESGYTLEYFKINEEAFAPVKADDHVFVCSALLSEDDSNIECKYTILEMTDGVYEIRTHRFTEYFSLTLIEEPKLEYEVASQGGLPDLKLIEHDFLPLRRGEVNELSFPYQGYLIQWYPKDE